MVGPGLLIGHIEGFVGVSALMVYMIFAMTLYLLPPSVKGTLTATTTPAHHCFGGE
jgi:hypothetical protein